MIILLKDSRINYNLYHTAVLHETFAVISFCVKDEIGGRCLQLPLCFKSSIEAKEAYIKIIVGRNSLCSLVDISSYDCHWPTDLAQKIEQYAQYLFDISNP